MEELSCNIAEMANSTSRKSDWTEVAPTLFISWHKISNSPLLETIPEEECEYDEDDL